MTRRLPFAALALALLGAGCRVAAERGTEGGTARADVAALGRAPASEDGLRSFEAVLARTRPSLEDVFLRPPIHGAPPELRSASADGRFLLVEWRGVVRGADGRREWEEGSGLRLLELEPAPEGPGTGRRLDGILPPSPARRPPPGGGVATRIGAIAWSNEGHRLAVAREERVFIVDPAARRARELPRPEPAAPEEDVEPPAEEGAADEPVEEPERRELDGDEPALAGDVRALAFAPDDGALWIADDERWWSVAIEGGEPIGAPVVALEGTEAPPDELEWSDDRGTVAAVDPPLFAGDDAEPPAHVVHRATGERVTLEGASEIGEIEDVELSPDGRWLFAVEVDRSGEPPPAIVPDYLGERVETREARRLSAEDPPSPHRAWMWDTRTGAREELALPGDRAAWIRGVGWAPGDGPARFALHRRSADHRTAELWTWSEGTLALAFSEHDPRWVGGPTRRPVWTPDGERLVLGTEVHPALAEPGRSQLVSVRADGSGLVQITSVAGEVSDFEVADDGAVVLAASDEDPTRRYLARLEAGAVAGGGGAAERLPLPAGWNGIERALAGGWGVVAAHAVLGRPSELWLADRGGARPLTDTVPAGFEAVDWILPETIVVPSRDGTPVYAHAWLPEETSLERPDAPRAVVVFVHGAGYLQNVTDSLGEYEVNFLFHSRLARAGYVVVDADYRGSRGYGNRFRTDVQYHLGGLELDDIHAVVDRLAELGVVDPARAGVYGGSYGGFLTLMALLTAPDRWIVGAALRSVTDWRSYHPLYTQPRLGRPSTHPEAYARSSPIDHAAALEDPVLLLHGMMDDNVFAQDTIRMMEAFIDAGLDFEAMLYPSQAHAFEDGAHWLDEYRRIERFLVRHLGPPLASGAPLRPAALGAVVRRPSDR